MPRTTNPSDPATEMDTVDIDPSLENIFRVHDQSSARAKVRLHFELQTASRLVAWATPGSGRLDAGGNHRSTPRPTVLRNCVELAECLRKRSAGPGQFGILRRR